MKGTVLTVKYYPLKLKPVTKSAIWGGTQIPELFSIGEKGSAVAEAWILTMRPDGINVIENGAYTGTTLEDYIKEVGNENVYGSGEFPLLKLLDAREMLSVQVHPDDDYAHSHGLDAGKTEMWYILDAKPGAALVNGIKDGVTAEKIKECAESGGLDELLNYVPVKKGDCFYIPAGLVHAIGEGILIAEIQQNSNTTYRLYDYDRVDKNGNKRELHIESASEVIKSEFDLADTIVNKVISDTEGTKITELCKCGFFDVKDYCISKGNSATIYANGKMVHLICVSGNGHIEYEGIKYRINKGDSYLLPATLTQSLVITADSALELIITRP